MMAGPEARALVRALRPDQWIKNVVVLAPLVFALGDQRDHVGHPAAFGAALLATALFCALSGAVYLLNDLADRVADRRHPAKCRRPLAAGELRPGVAVAWSGGLAAGALALGALALPPGFAISAAAYAALQTLYSAALKRVAILDVAAIAGGFVLRALAGAFAIGVKVSPWLLVCAFLLALFLALCKRREELASLSAGAEAIRPALGGYTTARLDRMIVAAGAAVVIVYAAYTFAPGTLAKFHTARLAWTVPPVALGVLRYVVLVRRGAAGAEPGRTLAQDGVLLGSVLVYGMVALLVLLGTG